MTHNGYTRPGEGFTLIEIVMVVSIVGILAAVAIPAYHDYTTRARVVEAAVLWVPIRENVQEFYAFHGRFPENNREAGLLEPTKIRGAHVASVEVADGAIHVQMGDDQPSSIAGGIVSLQPVVNSNRSTGIVLWSCSSRSEALDEKYVLVGEDRTNMPRKYLPKC